MLTNVLKAVLHGTGEETEAGEGVTCRSHTAPWGPQAVSPPLRLCVWVRGLHGEGTG